MRYAITHTARGQGYRVEHAETPVKALHCAIELRARGSVNVGISDLETGEEFEVEAFARAHDLSVIPDDKPPSRSEPPHSPSH